MARGGRKDHPIDREEGPVAEFVDDLRRLRGTLTLEELGRRMRYHPSTLSRRLTPKELPPQEFVDAYVRACGHDPEPWLERRRELGEQPAGTQPDDPADIQPDNPAATQPDDSAVAPPDAPAVASPPPVAPWWRRPRYLAPAAAVIAALLLGYSLFTPSESGTGPAAALLAVPVSGAPQVVKGYGFPTRIDRMAFRIFSPWWTQTAKGDVEFWSYESCPQGTTVYWVAVRPSREAVQFACNAWQYHKWTDVPPGTYQLETWKLHDGQAIKGSGVVKSSVPIVVHPKETPSPTPSTT
ncbi:helix-turn-helix domain-containing protein [Nonomuraea sp. NPDC003804]|uniref:helix-turn-helix domain-containing protein n=1 Tax=Nonomuraea sp. NPDC003804 TaxID=3154547 RepID=UPI0033ABA505